MEQSPEGPSYMIVFAKVCAIILDCPLSNLSASPCQIPLPLQTRAGRCDDLQSLPIETWPAICLCLKHGRAFARWPRNVRLADEILAPGQPVPSLWKIECVCDHENCGRRHTIYASREKDQTGLAKAIEREDPKVTCDGHYLVWRPDLMKVTEIAHNPPMR